MSTDSPETSLPEHPIIGEDKLFTRRQWLTFQAILAGANMFLAVEAVASTAIEHPEWDMDEKKTWQEWEAYNG